MAKVVGTKCETIHTVELTQRELDVICSLLGQVAAGSETDVIFDELKAFRSETVRFSTAGGSFLSAIKILPAE
jgi:hypothetical protein